MLLCKRDWMLIRGRLRYFAPLTALPTMPPLTEAEKAGGALTSCDPARV